MRDIKFRTFEKSSKEMTYGREAMAVKNFTPNYRWLESEVEVMQYTGVKDVNGIDVYEGDILKIWENDDYVPNRDSGGGIIDYDIREGFSQLGMVSFNHAWFVYGTKKHLAGQQKDIFAPLDFCNNCEVVGNVHEHPHLLEEERT